MVLTPRTGDARVEHLRRAERLTSVRAMDQVEAVVHVVDDDEAFRNALRRVLAACGFRVATYASAGEFLLADPGDGPGCMLLDVLMPGPGGLQLQSALVRRGSRLPVVMMSGRADIPMSVAAFKLGAIDFLTKPIDEDVLMETVGRAVGLSQTLTDDARRGEAARQRLAHLSPREHEVFDALVLGRMNKQIAADLGTGERTVKAHRASVMRKLGVHSTADLARMDMDARALEARVAIPE
jgi:FixJ family two-component response regulator